jgi:hypothetical protein
LKWRPGAAIAGVGVIKCKRGLSSTGNKKEVASIRADGYPGSQGAIGSTVYKVMLKCTAKILGNKQLHLGGRSRSGNKYSVIIINYRAEY